MDTTPHRRRRDIPAGPRDSHSPSQSRQVMSPSMPSTSVSASGLRHGYPEMIQTSRTSAISPTASAQVAEYPDIRTGPSPPDLPNTETAAGASTATPPSNRHQASSRAQSKSRLNDYRERHYPHAPPPARHRSRSPANSPPPPPPPHSQMDTESEYTHTNDFPCSRAPSQQAPSSPLRQEPAPFQSANLYHTQQQQRDSRRLLPTPVRAPRAFCFELAPSTNEFMYNPESITTQQNADQNHQSQFHAIPRPVRGTLRAVSDKDLNLVYSGPESFNDSRRLPENYPLDPHMREVFGAPFLYESAVDYQTRSNVEGEEMVQIPSSPPAFDQFAVFEESREESGGTIRQVTEDSSQFEFEVPGMWQSSEQRAAFMLT